MAREFTPLNTNIWTDQEFTTLSIPAQLLYLTAISHPTITYAGVLDWRPNRLAALSPTWTTELIEQAGEELEEKHYLIIDKNTEEAFVRSMYRNDNYLKMRNLGTTTANDINKVASRKIHHWITRELHRLHQDRPTLKGFESEKLQEYMQRNPTHDTPNNPQNQETNPRIDPYVDPHIDPRIDPYVDPQIPENNPSNGGSNGGSDDPSPTTYNYQLSTIRAVSNLNRLRGARADASDDPAEIDSLALPTAAVASAGEPPAESVPGCASEPEGVEGWAGELAAARAALAVAESLPGRCERHAGVPDSEVPPCGGCGRERRRVQRMAEEARKRASEARSGLVGHCSLCDENGLVKSAVSGGSVMSRCDHGLDGELLAAAGLRDSV